ncbi:ankyrin repeat-containing domain protein [Rhexocercosporidium sp. MPI-PUGE-AT-0058]|nr:ankyrin repeat-containing domain protein [Rhexocercosporidium sp. MPI-PUGE-AT-0058]
MEPQWELHRQRIKELYIDQKKTVDDIRRLMKEERNFSASNTGYERHLRKWKLTKNVDGTVIQLAKIGMERREGELKDTEVYFRGVHIPKLVIRKKAARCRMSTMERHQLMRSTAPPELILITPTSEDYMACVMSNDLPWIYFQKQVASFVNIDHILGMSREVMRLMIPSLSPSPSQLVDVHLNQIIQHLCVIMPVEGDDYVTDSLKKIFGNNDHEATTEFLKLAVYLVSNKFWDMYYGHPGRIFCDHLVRWFQLDRNRTFLREILSNKTPTIEAFMEGIFASAVYAEDLEMLVDFLRSGINPNILVPASWAQETPIVSFSRSGNIRLVKIFLDAGGNLNGLHTWRNPLLAAARAGHSEVVELLVSRGAAVDVCACGGEVHDCQTSALQWCALAGNFEMARFLLDKGARIDAISGDCGSALECALRTEATRLVDMLLERGADVNCEPTGHGNTPLQSAAMSGSSPLVQRLLGLGADVNGSPAVYGRTALQHAASNGDLEMCQILMQAGAEVNAAPGAIPWGFLPTTALGAAVKSGNHSLVTFMLQCGANPNDDRGFDTALEAATDLGDAGAVRILLSAGADPSRDQSFANACRKEHMQLLSVLIEYLPSREARISEEALCAAVESQNAGVVQLLLDAGFCPSDVMTSGGPRTDSLAKAIELGNPQIIEALLKAGAPYKNFPSPRESGLDPLQMACWKANKGLVHYLLKHGADLNRPAARGCGRTALQAAVESRDTELILLLLREGADVNAPPAAKFGVTALYAAIDRGNANLVEVLLEGGVDVHTLAYLGLYPRNSLQRAAEQGDNEIIHMLIAHGADVNSPPYASSGKTGLQAAAFKGHYRTVKLLLQNGANVNSPPAPFHGRTALQAAAQGGYLRIAEVLLENGAHVDVRGTGDYYRTPLEAAAEKGHIDMLKLLLNAGADITRTEGGRQQLKNAILYATERGHDAAAKFLKYHRIC